jgi:hypothetical protein
MRNNTFLYTRLSASFVNGLCVMLDNKDSLLILSFALQDVLRYILNGGTQLLSFQANYVEGNFWPSYRIRSLLLLSLICDVSSFSSYLRSYQHSTSTRRYARKPSGRLPRAKKVALKELEKLGTLKQQGILIGLFPAILCFQNVIFHSKV